MSDIETRIEKLERTSRYWRGATVVLLVLLIAVLVGGATAPSGIPDTLRARRLELLGLNDKPVIIMGSQGRGSALSMVGYGSARRRAIGLSVDENGARLLLMRNSEAPLLTAQVDDTGSSIIMSDGREASRGPRSVVIRSVYAEKNVASGTGIALMKGPYSRDIEASLSMQESGGSSLMLGGPNRQAARMLVNQDSGKVEFLSPDGKSIWTTP